MTSPVLDQVVALLDALLDATPPPPAGDDPAAVLDLFAVVARRRGELIGELMVLAPVVSHEPAVRERHAMLNARDEVWMAALGRAQGVAGERLGGMRRAARAYGR